MPPFSRRRRFEAIRRWRESLDTADRPTLLIRDDPEDDTVGNSSPSSRKSRRHSTFQRRRDGKSADNGSVGEGNPVDEEGSGSELDAESESESESESSASESEEGGVEDSESDSSSDSGSEDEAGQIKMPGDEEMPPPMPTLTFTATSTVAAPVMTATAALPSDPTPPVVETSIAMMLPSDTSVPTLETTPIPSPTSSLNVVPVMTTTPIADVPDQSRKGLDSEDDEDLDAIETVPFSAIETSGTTSLLPADTPLPAIDGGYGLAESNKESDNDVYNDRGGQDRPPPRGLDSTAEHLLIAAGAIGAFILVCFFGWVGYRLWKKSQGPSEGGNGFGDKFTWRRKDAMSGTWANNGVYLHNEPPPTYSKGNLNTMQAAGYYDAGKTYPRGSGSMARSVGSNSQRGTYQQGRENGSPIASVIDQYPTGGGETMDSSDINQTMRSGMPDSYYSQSGMAREPSRAYDPGQRQTYRASGVSSISSGFGDGDIVMPQGLSAPKPPQAQTSDSNAERSSWMSRDARQRETVYTTTSEDRPARFRSINSWVNQQTGRMKRADGRAQERGEVPVMPAIPGQISATQQTAYR